MYTELYKTYVTIPTFEYSRVVYPSDLRQTTENFGFKNRPFVLRLLVKIIHIRMRYNHMIMNEKVSFQLTDARLIFVYHYLKFSNKHILGTATPNPIIYCTQFYTYIDLHVYFN